MLIEHAAKPLSVLAAITGVFTTPWKHRNLIWRLAKRELETKHKGSALGVFWTALIPLAMVGIYYFVFAVVLRGRWGSEGSDRGQFALLLFSGLIVFGLFSECIGRAPGLVIENAAYVKKVVFPLEILPCVQLCTALVNAGVSFVMLAIFYPFTFGAPSLAVLLLPFLVAPMVLMILGISWFLSSIGVFLRDMRPLIGLLLTVLMFLSPVFYPIEMVPERFRGIIAFSPITIILESVRDVLFWRRLPNLVGLGFYVVISLIVASAGYWWFMRTKKAFADVV